MATCPANVRETKSAFGMLPQTTLTTPNAQADLWDLLRTNSTLLQT